MNNAKYQLLWVDDEIELLTAHIIYLKGKGYEVDSASNGYDAIEKCSQQAYDLILLDENMPGLSGLETLSRIKEIVPDTPVVMVTKSEEENIMNQAIGSKIADYLIKPVNPTQILLTLKKNIHRSSITAEVTQKRYLERFERIGSLINSSLTFDQWKEVYRQLVFWEQELAEAGGPMLEALTQQKREANAQFAKFIRANYIPWLKGSQERPLMSPDIFKRCVFPALDQGEKVFLVVIDNFRFDQWRTLAPELSPLFTYDENLYLSILPTVTQYARNAIFSGLMPAQIERMFPTLWVDEDSEEGKNMNEAPMIQTHLERYRRRNTFSYHKVNDSLAAEKLVQQMPQLRGNDLNVIVLNFIDMLSHARTESRMVRELANNEAAYRSITLSWFRHSPVRELFRAISSTRARLILTTDHGSIRCGTPIKVAGDKNTNTNLRYKLGKNLHYNPREVFEITNPAEACLPAPSLSTAYIFATRDSFFAYPNNYNYYVSYFRDTFQHGGVSLEEMLVPLVTLHGKNR